MVLDDDDDAVAAVDGQRLQKRGNDIPDDDDDDTAVAALEDDTPATVAAAADAEHAPSYESQAASAHQLTFANYDEPRRNSWPYWQLWRHVLHWTIKDDYCPCCSCSRRCCLSKDYSSVVACRRQNYVGMVSTLSVVAVVVAADHCYN